MIIIILSNLPVGQPLPIQNTLTNRVPVPVPVPVPVVGIPVVFGTPLLTLFIDCRLHESDTVLSAPPVAQLAFCVVSCFRILESANTIGTFVVYIPVTNTVVKRITTISVRL